MLRAKHWQAALLAKNEAFPQHGGRARVSISAYFTGKATLTSSVLYQQAAPTRAFAQCARGLIATCSCKHSSQLLCPEEIKRSNFPQASGMIFSFRLRFWTKKRKNIYPIDATHHSPPGVKWHLYEAEPVLCRMDGTQCRTGSWVLPVTEGRKARNIAKVTYTLV